LLLLLSSSIYRFRYSCHYTIYLRNYQRVITSFRSHTHHELIGKEKPSVALAGFLVRTTSTSCHPAAGRRPSNKKPSTSIIPNALPGVYATSSLIHLQKPSRTCPHTNTPASHPDNQPVLGPLQTRKQSVTERKASTTCHPHPSTHEYIISQDTSINIVVGVAVPSYSAQSRYTTAVCLFLNFRPYRIVPYPQPLPPKARYDRHTRPSKKT